MSIEEIYRFQGNDSKVPILISIPHGGTHFPDSYKELYHSHLISPPVDTDWYVGRLYEFASLIGACIIEARYSRYVIDLNRPADGKQLYDDGRTETGLVPTHNFAGKPLYKDDASVPTKVDIEERVKKFYLPYHNKVGEELHRLKGTFGKALLFEAHSIRRRVPLLSPKPFPDLIVSNQKGKTCHQNIFNSFVEELKLSPYSVSKNSPFMGGYLTRKWGVPEQNIHSIQLEISQDIYMNEQKFEFSESKGKILSNLLEKGFIRIIEELEKL